MRCKYEGCEDEVYSKGFCRRHLRWVTESKTFEARKDRLCQQCGGTIPTAARIDQKFCSLSCKMKWHRRHGSQTKRGRCKIDGCDKPLHTKTLCRTHYMRQWRYGDAWFVSERVAAREKPKGQCAEGSCREQAVWKGLCKAHYMRAYVAANRLKWNAYRSSRRSYLRTATPPWADKAKIRRIYELCAKITLETGVEHHVDHIVPLRGKKVCGLHTHENLQVLPGAHNRKKSAKHE